MVYRILIIEISKPKSSIIDLHEKNWFKSIFKIGQKHKTCLK